MLEGERQSASNIMNEDTGIILASGAKTATSSVR